LKRSNNPTYVTEYDPFALQTDQPGIITGSSLSEDEKPLPDWMSSAVPEYLVTSSSSGAMMEIKDDVRRIKRKVSMMARAV